MFEYEVDGKIYEVSEELLDTFKKKYPNAVEKKKQQEQAGKTEPQVTGAPVEETAAPEDTVSKPEDTSLESQLIETKPKKSIVSAGVGAVGAEVITKPAELTYKDALDKLAVALESSDRDVANYFAEDYFKVSEAPSKYYTDQTYTTGVAGGMQARVPDREKNIKEYLKEQNKLEDYESFVENPVEFFNNLPENLKNQYREKRKEKLATDFFTRLSEEEQLTYKSLIENSTIIFDDYNKSVESLTKQQEDFKSRYQEDLDNLDSLEKQIKTWDDNNLRRLDIVTESITANYFAGKEDKAKEFEDLRNSLINERKSLLDKYNSVANSLSEKGFEDDRTNLLNSEKAITKKFEDNKILYDNIGNINSSFKAAQYSYDLKQKAVDQIKSTLFNVGGNVAAFGASGLKYLAGVNKMYGTAAMMDELSNAASSFANDAITEYQSKYAPTMKVMDVKSFSDFGTMALSGLADQATNIATVWAGGAVVNTLAKTGSAIATINTVQKATTGLMGMYSGSSQYSSMDITQEQAALQLPELYSDREKTDLTQVEKNILDQKIHELEQGLNISELSKVTTAIGYGVTEALAEKFGTMRVISKWSDFNRAMGGLTTTKKFLSLPKYLAKGIATEEVEEIATQIAQNYISSLVDDTVSPLDGVDLDLVTSTAFTSFVLQGQGISQNVSNLLGEITVNKAERKEYEKMGNTLISLLAEKQEAKEKGEKFKKNKEIRKIVNELGRKSAINFVKLQSLSKSKIQDLFANESKKKALLRQLQDLGTSDVDQKTKDTRYKEILDEIKILENTKEALLQNVFVKKYKGTDELGRTVEKNAERTAKANLQYGEFELYTRLAKSTVGDKRYIDVYTKEELEERIKDFPEESRQDYIDSFNDMRSIGANGFFNAKLNTIFINRGMIEHWINGQILDPSMSLLAPMHELGHWAMFNMRHNDAQKAALKRAADNLSGFLKSKNVSSKVVEDLAERIKVYEEAKESGEIDINDYEMAQEVVMAYYEQVLSGRINENDIETAYGLRDFIRITLNRMSPGLDMYSNISTPEGIVEFIKDFGAKVKQGQLKATSPEDEKKLRELISKSYSLGQKELNDRIDNLVGKKDENGNYQWNSKEEFQASEEFVNVYDKLINGNLIDPLIRRGIEGDFIYGKPIERFIEDVKDGLTGTIMRFDPTANNSLIGWINLQLGRRKGDVSNQYKKEQGEFGTTSLDIEAGETGSVREIAADDIAFDEAIDMRQEEIVDARAGLIIPGEILGKKTSNEIIEKIRQDISDFNWENLSYKKLDGMAAEYVSEFAGVPVAKILDPKKNLSSSEAKSAQQAIFGIADQILPILPEGAITEDAVSEDLRGTSTGVPRKILQAFYEKNPERRTEAQGLYEFRRRTDVTQQELLAAFGMDENGNSLPGFSGRSPESQAIKAFLNLFDRIITNTALRIAAEEIDVSPNVIQDIRSGTQQGVYQLPNEPKDAIEEQDNFFDTIDKFVEYEITLSNLNPEIAKFIGLDNAELLSKDNIKPYDKPAGKQNFPIDKIARNVRGQKELLSRLPKTFVNDSNQTLLLNSINHTGRSGGSIILSKDIKDKQGNVVFKKGDVNPSYLQEDYYKFVVDENGNKIFDQDLLKEAAANNSQLLDVAGSNYSIQKQPLTVKFLDNLNKEIKKYVKENGPIKSLLPPTGSGVNYKNIESNVKKRIPLNNIRTAYSQLLQATIVDTLNDFENRITEQYNKNKKVDQDLINQYKDFLGYIPNIYTGTANDSGGFRMLAELVEGESYALLNGSNVTVEHVPANIRNMTKMMRDNLFSRKVSDVIVKVAFVPVTHAKNKNKSKKLKLAGNEAQVFDFFAKQRKNIGFKGAVYSLSENTLEDKFAAMISLNDARITPGQTLDLATAKNLAAQRKKRFDIIGPGANDFDGLLYAVLADGELGEEQYEWIKENLYKPYNEAHYRLNNARQNAAIRFKQLEKKEKELFKKLKQDSGFGGFTYEQALRVWLFNKIDQTPSGLNEDTKDALIKIVKNNPDIEQLGKDLSAILPMKEFWVEPDPNNWQVEGIKQDMIDAIEKVTRKQYLAEWKANVDEIFSKNNMNKLLAAFGEEYVDAMKDMLYRMETGQSRPEGSNKRMNVFMNWVRGSVATTMFFNRRSAVLQQISNVNFLNWGDNNPIAAAKAFANFDQYSKDFLFILNSNYLKERRGGLKTDVNAADLAEAIKRGGYRGFLATLLQKGFSLTQYGDSFAIATGGATFYRNRINTYLKQGKTQEQAEKQAFLDFQELSEETQQSARPDRLSQEQTNILGRTFLAFQNTPMQMTRLAVKAGKDLVARRGDPKEKIFKMAYYGVIQSTIFSLLQTALIGDMFSAFSDDEDDTDDELKQKKTRRLINNIVDSFLKGTGIYGAFVATAKNAALKFYEQQQRIEQGKRPDYAYVVIEALNVSPPIGIKARNFYGALKNYEYNSKYIEGIGYNLNNPALDIGSSLTESLFNIPAHNVLTTIRDLDAMVQEDVDTWHRIALGLGWHTWDLGLEDKQLDDIKAEIKEINKQLRKSKKIKRGSR
jgi:hypothetical protein